MTEPTATFNPALIAPLDRVRDALGDTNVTAPFKPDVTYLAYLSAYGGDERRATIAVADALVTKYSQEPDEVVVENGETVRWKDRVKAWRDTSARLRTEIVTEQAQAQARAQSGLMTARATRPGREHAEYYAGGRPPWED